MFDRKIFGTSSEIFGSLREPSENFRKCSESFVCPSDSTLKNFYRRSEFIGKSSSCFLLELTADQVDIWITPIGQNKYNEITRWPRVVHTRQRLTCERPLFNLRPHLHGCQACTLHALENTKISPATHRSCTQPSGALVIKCWLVIRWNACVRSLLRSRNPTREPVRRLNSISHEWD